jgi:hypothetical protein
VEYKTEQFQNSENGLRVMHSNLASFGAKTAAARNWTVYEQCCIDTSNQNTAPKMLLSIA